MPQLGPVEYAIPFFGERRPILIDLLDISDHEIETFYKHIRRINDKIYAESFIQSLNKYLLRNYCTMCILVYY